MPKFNGSMKLRIRLKGSSTPYIIIDLQQISSTKTIKSKFDIDMSMIF